ncbi:hypothetical protein BU17DRAFT_85608 [Hysterangium stoloniferum]|nr:hypothetical protein BU17DRAFT_85608 [Hysterangium stoloniferum]
MGSTPLTAAQILEQCEDQRWQCKEVTRKVQEEEEEEELEWEYQAALAAEKAEEEAAKKAVEDRAAGVALTPRASLRKCKAAEVDSESEGEPGASHNKKRKLLPAQLETKNDPWCSDCTNQGMECFWKSS